MRCRTPAAFILPVCFFLGIRASAEESERPTIGGRPLAATCGVPAPATVVRNRQSVVAWLLLGAALGESGGAEGTARTAGAERTQRTEEILHRWAAASASLEPMTEARLRRVTRASHGRNSGHEIDVLATLQRPVSAAELTHRFEWTLASGAGEPVELTAVPRDPIERLFVPRLAVTINSDTGLPSSVRFGNRGGTTAGAEIAITPPPRISPFDASGDAAILQTAAVTPDRAATRTEPNVLTSVQRRASQLVAHGDPTHPPREVADVLRDWEAATNRFGSCEIQFRRYVYDCVFNIERRAAGRAIIADAARARLEIEPAELEPGEVSRRSDPTTGKPFRLERDHADLWVWNGKQVTQANPADKTCWEWKLPDSAAARPHWMWGAFRLEKQMPFLQAISEADLRRRFDISLDTWNDEEIRLTLKPRLDSDAAAAREYRVILSAATLLTDAVQILDPTGNVETVYVVKRRIQRPAAALPAELFAPQWDGWKMQQR